MTQQEPVELSGGGSSRSDGGWQSLSRMRVAQQARIGDKRILSGADFVEKAWVEGALSLERHIQIGQLG
jgi:hypothetical protein